MSKGTLYKITINPEGHCLNLRFAKHPSETHLRVVKKFIVSYLLSEHNLREYSEVCQGGVPDLITKEENLCIWLEPPKPRDYTKYQQIFEFQLLLECKGLSGEELNDTVWNIEEISQDTFLLNQKEVTAVLSPLD